MPCLGWPPTAQWPQVEGRLDDPPCLAAHVLTQCLCVLPSLTEKNTPQKPAPSTPSLKRKKRQTDSPVRMLPGLWYLAAAPPAPAPPALAYISAPIMPYPPPTVYYATPAPTSVHTASPQPAQGPRRTRHSVQLGLNDLEELQAALREAARAAENVRSTTRQLSHSLSADLRHARSLRGSCLF